MKGSVYNLAGDKTSEIEMPHLFDSPIREDIVAKYVEAAKLMKAKLYSNFKEAGKRHSASGTISHRRHEWKGHYGKGIARVPRKAMWRRGTQFYWVGAEVSSARGGRRAHPPRAFISPRKINDNEIRLAMISGLASTAHEKLVIERYSSIDKLHIKVPVVVESLENAKAKQVIEMLDKLFGQSYEQVLKSKSVRPGKGKLRGRKYKSNAGILVIKGNSEKFKMAGLEVIAVNDLEITDLYPLGRLTIFTQKALEELKNVA